MAYVARRRALRVRPAIAVGAACLALAALSLLLSWRPTYDPWAWLVFGREVSDPHLGVSKLAHTGWKPLAVLFTVPFGLFGSAAPFLWMIVPRAAGLASLALAYRLGSRSAGGGGGGGGAAAAAPQRGVPALHGGREHRADRRCRAARRDRAASERTAPLGV